MPPELESTIVSTGTTKNMSAAPKPRPKYYELNLAHHWPPAVLSIFHRVSGVLLFFPLLPLLLWMLQSSLASEEGYARWRDVFANPVAKLAVVVAACGASISSTISAAMTSGRGGSRSHQVTHRGARRCPAMPRRGRRVRRR